MSTPPEQELSALVTAFRARLEWWRAHGAVAVAATPSPRVGASGTVHDDAARDEQDPARAELPGAPEPELGPSAATSAARGPELGPSAATSAARGPELSPLELVRSDLGDCRRCRLASGRRTIVFGQGNPHADLMFIGEAPGHEEDQQGQPFVGAAGQLLTRMIEAMGLGREDVYIANIIKCRPPNNRDPSPDEIEACEPFLRRKIDAIAPRIIIALGNFAARTLLRTETGISQLRGRFHSYHGTPLMPTFHPAFLLRNPERKRPVWEDLKLVMAEMDRLGLARRGKP